MLFAAVATTKFYGAIFLVLLAVVGIILGVILAAFLVFGVLAFALMVITYVWCLGCDLIWGTKYVEWFWTSWEESKSCTNPTPDK